MERMRENVCVCVREIAEIEREKSKFVRETCPK